VKLTSKYGFNSNYNVELGSFFIYTKN